MTVFSLVMILSKKVNVFFLPRLIGEKIKISIFFEKITIFKCGGKSSHPLPPPTFRLTQRECPNFRMEVIGDMPI